MLQAWANFTDEGSTVTCSFNAHVGRIGTAALDADHRIIYDQATGVFPLRTDGNGAQATIVFGVVDGD